MLAALIRALRKPAMARVDARLFFKAAVSCGHDGLMLGVSRVVMGSKLLAG